MALNFIRSFLWPEISNGSKWAFYNIKNQFYSSDRAKTCSAKVYFLTEVLLRYAEESDCKTPYSCSLKKANSAFICSDSYQVPWNLRPCFEPQCLLLTPVPELCFSQSFIFVLFPFKQIKINIGGGNINLKFIRFILLSFPE